MKSWIWALSLLTLAVGCDDDKAKSSGGKAQEPSSSAPPPSATASSAPPRPPEPPVARPPAITVDDRGCTVDGVSFAGAPAEWQGRLAAALAQNAKVPGEAVAISVMRDTKAPKVEAVVASLGAAKARSVVVRTPTRDQTTGELELTLHHAGGKPPAECSVVAMIEQNGSVAVWAKGGGGASKFSRGMAGPDLSSSTEALRKRAAACDSATWFVGAAETVTWGLVFDLAARARGGAEAGATLKPTETVLLTQAPVAGRPVKEEP
jgi:hypothetical protein